MRLIDADALMEQYDLKDATKYGNKNEEQKAHSYSTLMLYEIADMIEDAPTTYDIDKVVEQLEEQKSGLTEWAEDEAFKLATDDAIKIVKQEAEQYNNAIIDGNYCFQSCACTEKCDKCSRLCNGDIDWYENIDNWT